MTFYSRFPDYYEAVFPFRPATFDFLIRQKARKGAGVLDLGCGTGRYAGEFAGHGFRSVGVDLDEAMIDHATRHYGGAEFVCRDIRTFRPGAGGFDLAFCIGNTLAHLPPEDLEQVIQNVRELLVPGGTWVIQTVNWDRLKGPGEFLFPDIVLPEKNITFSRRYIGLGRDTIQFATQLKSSQKTLFKGEVNLHPVLKEQYVRLHTGAGLVFKKGYGDFSGSQFNPFSSVANVMVFTKEPRPCAGFPD